MSCRFSCLFAGPSPLVFLGSERPLFYYNPTILTKFLHDPLRLSNPIAADGRLSKCKFSLFSTSDKGEFIVDELNKDRCNCQRTMGERKLIACPEVVLRRVLSIHGSGHSVHCIRWVLYHDFLTRILFLFLSVHLSQNRHTKPLRQLPERPAIIKKHYFITTHLIAQSFRPIKNSSHFLTYSKTHNL